VGRTRVIIGGFLVFATAVLLYASATGPALLVAGRVLQGVAGIAAFQIGIAYLGDITKPGKRDVAFASYTPAMGLGFTVGPVLGGVVAGHWGTRASYGVGAC